MITADSSWFFMRSPGDWKTVLPKHEAVMRENTERIHVSSTISNNKKVN